jgi:hypothetical protein
MKHDYVYKCISNGVERTIYIHLNFNHIIIPLSQRLFFFLSILKSFNLLNLTISMKNSDIGPLTDFICTIQSLNVKWWVPSIVAIKHH